MKYAISDIHGMFDKFLQLLGKINFSDTDVLYIIGDVIDRGDKPIETLEYIMGKPNMHLLMGNHEYWMLGLYDAYLQRKLFPYELLEAKQVWMQNGENVTLKQFQKLPLNIWHDKTFNDKICIDCGAVYEADGGRLACLRIEDMKEFYA